MGFDYFLGRKNLERRTKKFLSVSVLFKCINCSRNENNPICGKFYQAFAGVIAYRKSLERKEPNFKLHELA
jgi:hypothetical protein